MTGREYTLATWGGPNRRSGPYSSASDDAEVEDKRFGSGGGVGAYGTSVGGDAGVDDSQSRPRAGRSWWSWGRRVASEWFELVDNVRAFATKGELGPKKRS